MSRPAIMSEDLDRNLTREQALALVDCSLEELLRAAARRRDAAHGSIVSYSRKVFVPLTKLCRDVCHYCTFAHPPRRGERAVMTLDEVLDVARAGAAPRGRAPSLHPPDAHPPSSPSSVQRVRCWTRPASCRTSIRACLPQPTTSA